MGENEADDEVTNGACLFSFPNEMAIKGSLLMLLLAPLNCLLFCDTTNDVIVNENVLNLI